MMSGREYVESLRRVHPRVYFLGEEVEEVVDHPAFKPHVASAAMTYELAQDPQHEDLMTATSHLTAERVNRFTHIHQSTDDLIEKVRMMRLLGQRTGSCFQRCVGFDGLNTLYAITYDIDDEFGTDYHQRFIEYLTRVQREDLMVAGAMTDVKGDRGKRPHEQEDPDLYLHVVEKRDDGIVVRGAKNHITGTVNSHEILAMPTRAMSERDEDYAVSFAVPVDAEGITLVFGRQTNDTRRLQGEIDSGNAKYGVVGGECLIIFDDVFVPWDRVFMCGEYAFTGPLVKTFSSHHRSNYGGCKVGVVDVLIGATRLIAEANGVERAPHVRDKISEMVHLAETCWSCSLACAHEGQKTRSGACTVNHLLANVVKLNVSRLAHQWTRLAQDIAGGALITLPSEKDYGHPIIGRYIDKYYRGRADIPTENRIRIFRLIENMAVGGGLPEYVHGAGSPATLKIMIERTMDIEGKKALAETVAGIKGDEHFQRIWGVEEEEYFREFREKRGVK
ncbi:MAG: 4-hydroxyphenylacetate 3-hydroxylase family protein [Candidatus Geothermarchaeales archaeon]